MSLVSKFAAPVVIGLIILSNTARADEEMNRILDEAMPFMHHSCASVVAEYGDDEEKVGEIVRLMVAVSLFNRSIDVEQLFPEDAARDALKDEFIKALEETCEADPDTLLAGAVDTATKDAIN